MKNLILILTLLVSSIFSQEYKQKQLRIVYNQPFADGAHKFNVVYVQPDSNKVKAKDSIFEETHALNNSYNRYSSFLWEYLNPRVLVFFTSVINLYTDPYFKYTYYD